MKKYAMVMVAVVAITGIAQATPVWSDNFDGYADQAAMDAVYTQIYPTYPALLETAKGSSDSQSVHFGLPTANSQRRMYKNFGGEYDGTDANPLKLEVMIDVDTLIWSTRQYIEIRGYSGAGYADGSLGDLIAIGANSSGVPDTTKYAGRMLAGSQAGWFSTAAAKSTDWTKLTVLIKSTVVEFYVNDVLDTTKARGAATTYDCIVIGSGLSSAGADVWFDDLTVETIPEPTTLLLLGLGGLFLRRRTA